MDRKKIGVALIMALMAALLIYSIVSSVRVQNLKKENESLQSTTPQAYEEKVDVLTGDLEEAQRQLAAANHNNENEVVEAAEYFLETFYSNNNNTEFDQLKKIQPLVSGSVYKSLIPENDGENDGTYEMNGLSYKTWVSDLQTYYRFNSNTSADIFIYCTLHVQSGSTVNTASPFIFSATMIFENQKWIVNEIHQNQTIRAGY